MTLRKNNDPRGEQQDITTDKLEELRGVLLTWREDLQTSFNTSLCMEETSVQEADAIDRATQEEDRNCMVRNRARTRSLILEITAALERMDDGTYGFCEETGEPIGLARLEARPLATLCVEAQEYHERQRKMYR